MDKQATERAFCYNDKPSIGRLVAGGAPMKGYSMGYSLAHMAVLNGDLAIVKLTQSLSGSDWEPMCGMKNDKGQTPRDLALSLQMIGIVDHLDTYMSSREKSPNSRREWIP